MNAVSFPQANRTLTRPSNMTDEECFPLPIWSDGTTCVSLWKPNLRERISILLFGKIWLHVVSGQTQPPVAIQAAKSIFTESK